MASLDFRICCMDILCWLLCLQFFSMGMVAPQSCELVTDSGVLKFDTLENDQNSSMMRQDSGGLIPLYRMQRLFLNAVQPNPFPKELLRSVLQNSSTIETSQIAKYEAGYVTCAVIAILYLIFVLAFGLTFCIFQCRSRRVLPCEGGICLPTPIYVLLLCTFCLLFAGIVCTFYLNQKTHEEVGRGVQDLTRILQNFRSSVSSIPQAIDKVVSDYSIPKSRVFADLQSFTPAVNESVNAKLTNEIRPLIEEGLKTTRDLERAAQIVVDVNMTLMNLQRKERELLATLISHRDNLLAILSEPSCEDCSDAASIIQNVQLNPNQSQVPSISVDKLVNVRKVNLTGIFLKALQVSNDMPKLVTTQADKSFTDIRSALNNAEQEIKSYASKIPILRYIDPIDKEVLNVQLKIEMYGHEVERYEYYRWVIGVVLCCILLLIAICTVLGLLFGLWGLYLLRDPENSRLRRRDGAGLLLIEVYLSLIFSWLIILFVFITFLVGGNVQTLVCKHWANGNIYRFLDDPNNLPRDINLKKELGLRENSNITDMYRQCKDGAPIWNVIQLNPIDLDSILNISQYTGELQKQIDNFNVNVPGLDMLTNIAVLVLQDYNNSGLNQVPLTSIVAQIKEPSFILEVAKFIPLLESLASTQSNATIRSELDKEAAALRDIQNASKQDQESIMGKLNSSVQTLAVLAPKLQVGIQRTVQNIYTLKGPLIQGTIGQLKNETKCLLHQAIGYFSKYIDWVKHTITNNVASCRAVSTTLDNSRTVVCNHVTDPWNGFWFCLGWSAILLIPNILLSIKAAQYIAPKSRISMT
ncbi:prominin-2 isoform X2 [Bufo gargarizans]|uniref:prominin-2 isoform X2 n=1 Tax=Bufo gargarizans TaxID=30331 RepID=UPI001CF4E91C|nr:prominin-2 isoform X2 [Bufo gargarizans]